MEIIISVLLVLVGFVLLMKGADFFVEGASSMAAKLGIPPLIIGLTIVAMGTSAPEAAISISAAIKGSTGIAIGNIYGSNIMNVLLILGLTSLITVLHVGKSTIRYEIPFMIFVTAVLAGMGTFFGELGRLTGVTFVVLFLIFMAYLFYQARHMENNQEEVPKDLPGWKIFLFIVGGAAAIVWGSDLTVEHATIIAKALGVSDRVIGLTIIAFGTSLPELVTSVAAARKKQADIAIGNIVGSNIFNVLFVLGIVTLIRPVAYSPAFYTDSIVCIATAVLLLLCVAWKRELKKTGGALMLICYAVYFVSLMM